MSESLNLEPEIALILDSFSRELSKLETDRLEERDKHKLKCEKYIKDVEANLKDYEKEIADMDLECRSEHTTYLDGLRQRFKDLIDSYNKAISASPKQRQNGEFSSNGVRPFDLTTNDTFSSNGNASSHGLIEEMHPHESDGGFWSIWNKIAAYFYACFCIGRRGTACRLLFVVTLGMFLGYLFIKLFVMSPTSTKHVAYYSSDDNANSNFLFDDLTVDDPLFIARKVVI